MTTTNPSKHTSSSKSSKKRSAHKVHTLPLATMAALLTAATCLGSQPAMAVPTTTITTPTQAGVVRNLANSTGTVGQNREYVPLGEKKPWLQYPNILEFRRLRGRNSDATEIKSDEEGSDKNWKTVNDKTAMYAHVETRGDSDYLVFDVFFNNNAKSMVDKSNKQWYLWQVPYAIADLDSNGLYKSDTVTNLKYDAYRPKKEGHILSQDPEAFEKDDSLSFSVPNMQQTDKHYGKKGYALYQVGIGLNPGDKVYDDLDQIFHGNANESLISRMAGDQTTYSFYNPQYNKNYGLGITVAKPYDDVAYHMHAELKLRPGAINKKADNYNEKYANIQNAWTWANSGSWGATTKSAYTVISGRDPNNDEDKDGKLKRNKTDRIAPKIYYNGKTEITDGTKTIELKEGDKLSFTTSDNKGYIEKFSISGLTKDPTVTQGAGSEDKPLPSGDITVTKDMNKKEVTITSEDGSGNVTTRKVKVKVTKKQKLSKEHPITGKTIDTTVGEPLPPLTDIDKFVTVKDGKKLEKQPTLTWNGNSAAPSTETVGVFTRSIKGTYSDESTNSTNVTINVKPQKPVIDTDLTNLAGKKGQKVTVSVGSGIPEGTTTTVKLFGKDNKEIGSTTTINGGKAEITVNGEIPAGDVYATTTVTKQPETLNAGKIKIPGFDLTSENSDTKQATKPQDTQAPTITATSSPVTVGQDLKIHIVATDDVKVEEINTTKALLDANLLQTADILSGNRTSVSKTTDTDQKQVLDLTVKNMQPKDVGTHTITFTVKDSAGNTGTTTLTITVKPAAPTVTPQDNGSVDVTPAAGTDSLEITYTPEGETNPTKLTVKKVNDEWKIDGNTPDGVTVDKTSGKVTIPANKVKDNTDVTAVDKKGENTSSEATGKAKKNPTTPATTPDAPTVTPQDNGSVDVTPAAGTDSLEITYTPEGETNPTKLTVKKVNDEWKIDGNTPDGVTVDKTSGKVTIPANKVKDNTDVTAVDKKGENTSKQATGKAKKNPTTPATTPDAPTVTPQDNGSVDVTPAAGTDSLEITYTPEGETNPTKLTVKKVNDEWKIDGNTPDGVTVDKTSGKVTIPANKVKDNTDVTAVDKKGENTSKQATGKAGNNNGNSGSGTGSGSDSGNDSTSNNGGSDSGSTTGGSSSTDSGAQNSTNESSSADNANNAGNTETGNAGNGNAGNASTGVSGSNASTKSGNKVPAKHSSQLVKTGAEVERVGLISAMIGALGAAAAFFSRKKNRE